MSSKINRVGSKTKATIQPGQNRQERQALADTLEMKVAGMKGSSADSKNKASNKAKPKKELTADEKLRKDFQRDHTGVRTMSDKAVLVASEITSASILNQEKMVESLGKVNTPCTVIYNEIQQMVFSSRPVTECYEALEHNKVELEAAQAVIVSGEDIDSHKRRLASEKRKKEKEEKKDKKGKAKNDGEGDEAEYDDDDDCEMMEKGHAAFAAEEWPEEDEPAAKRCRK